MAYFIYGFSKSQLENIDPAEGKGFKEAARHVLALTERELGELLLRGDVVEVSRP